MKAIDMLNAAAGHMKQRAGTYDQPDGERSMRRTVAAFNAVKGREVLTESDGWLLMELLKLARDQSRDTPHRDSLEDAVAYAALYGESRMAGTTAPGTRARFEAVRNRAMFGDPSAVEDLQSASESFLGACRSICSGDGIGVTAPATEPTADADGWIGWASEERPVPADTRVEVRIRGRSAVVQFEDVAGALDWRSDGGLRGITAYRIVRAGGA